MPELAYLYQVEKNIDVLLGEKEFKKAHDLCLRLINKYPNEKKLRKLKEKIEDAVRENNDRVVKNKLEEIDDLWGKDDYAQIIRELEPLLKIAPDNNRLKKNIKKAQGRYKEKIANLSKEFEKKNRDNLEKLFKEDTEGLLDELFEMEKNNPGNKQVQTIAQEYRDRIIEDKIKKKAGLLYSEKFDDIKNLLSQLKRIDEKNKQIEGLERLCRIREYGFQVGEKKDFVYEALGHLQILMQLKKYEQAIKVAEEILEINQTNIQVVKTLKKAQNEFYKETREEAVEKITKNAGALKQEYKQNKKAFVKI